MLHKWIQIKIDAVELFLFCFPWGHFKTLSQDLTIESLQSSFAVGSNAQITPAGFTLLPETQTESALKTRLGKKFSKFYSQE